MIEHITYSFSGSFSGGYRDIPLREGEAITDIRVSEAGRSYAPGASAELGSSGAPDTFGVDRFDDTVRVVWHYSAFNEVRTFDVSYTFSKLAIAYDDVVDVNLQVWGDEWEVELGSLHALMELPKPAPEQVRVWGHPGTVDGVTTLLPGGTGAELRASTIPPGYFTEMRVVFPRSVLTSTEGATVVRGDGLEKILDEELAFARAAERDRERIEWFKRNLAWLIPALLLLAVLPALALAFYIWWRWGKEPPVPPVPEHLHEPPGEDPPALIAALLSTGHAKVTGDAFAATLFDLIRRRYIDAFSTSTVKKTWGGLRSEDMSDLAISLKAKVDDGTLTPYEEDVIRCVRKALGSDERLLLSEFQDKVKKNPTYYAERFSKFKERVTDALEEKGWFETAGRRPAVLAAVGLGVAAGGAIALAVTTFDPVRGFPWASILWGFIAGALIFNEVVMIVFLAARRGWEKRTPPAAVDASKWSAFRNFLDDFAGIPQAVPGSIAIWEQFLVYGIAFGVADKVLAAAQLYAPETLVQQSPVFWIDPGGSLGSGTTSFLISDIASSVASAAAPSSSGGGGGFSGGGGGGGGGGAW